MSDGLINGVPLTRQALYRLIADEVCRDGVVEPHERAILEKMAGFLRLEADEARAIAMEAWDKRSTTSDLGGEPLDPVRLYSTALSFARADGLIDPIEEQMLAALRKLFRLSEEEQKAVHERFDHVPASPGAVSVGAAKGFAGAGDGPRIPLPVPGSTTKHLAMRLEHDPLASWIADHSLWFNVPNHASENARRGWEDFLRGMAGLNETQMYQGLDALDDALNSLDGVLIVDVILALATLRWSRVLLKTSFPASAVAEAREWPGLSLYQRFCVKLHPILISIDHLRNKTGIEDALAMTIVYLLEDLCMLVRRRHHEPVGLLGSLLPMVTKISPKARVTHRAIELIGPLASMVGRQGGTMSHAFVETCREICRNMPQNHPLTLAAHNAIASLAPDQLVFPKSYKPRINDLANDSFPAASQRLERLIREVGTWDEEERRLVKALSGADLSPIEEIQAASAAACRKSGIEPEAMAFRNLTAMAFPVLADHSRPVIAFFSLGNPGGHHEEMKGEWVQVLLKKLDDNRVQVIPDFPVFPSTLFMSMPLDEKGISALADALDRSGGAYDVALVDPGAKAVRIWHQTGDLDPTGNLFRVERELIEAGKNDEAVRCLERTLARHPWNSRAWLQKGLIAKRAGDLKAARQAFEAALQAQPHDPHTLTRLGVLDKNEKRMAAAEQTLRNALRILPTEPSAIVTLAALALGKVAGGESSALPLWDYYLAGLHASRGDSPDYREIAAVGDPVDQALSRIPRFTPVDTVFYL